MRKTAGITLLEVLIASVILVAVVMMAMATLFSSTSAATKGQIASDVEERGRRLLGLLRDDMSLAQFNAAATTVPAGSIPAAPTQMGYFGTAFYNMAVGYRIPGVLDVTGNAATVPSGNTVYGYRNPLSLPNTGFFQDLTCVLRFEADTVYKESSASPDPVQAADWGSPFPSFPVLGAAQILNLDLNNDGDQTDTFVRGKIVRYVIASATNTTVLAAHANNALVGREVVSDTAFFRVAGPAAGQFNADVEGHPAVPSYSGVLFGFVDQSGIYAPTSIQSNTDVTSKGRGLLVSVWHASPDDTGKAWILRNSKILIRFRIPQS